jgi:hypothetical protein
MNLHQAAMFIGSDGVIVCKNGYKLAVYVIDVQTKNDRLEALVSSKEIPGTSWQSFDRIRFSK